MMEKKRIGLNPWKLQYYCKKGKSAYMADLIDNDKSKQRELVHLLSMFEVAIHSIAQNLPKPTMNVCRTDWHTL